MSKHIVAITACATGIAHTYMAAESLEQAGKKRGDSVRVETQGSIGAENVLGCPLLKENFPFSNISFKSTSLPSEQ